MGQRVRMGQPIFNPPLPPPLGAPPPPPLGPPLGAPPPPPPLGPPPPRVHQFSTSPALAAQRYHDIIETLDYELHLAKSSPMPREFRRLPAWQQNMTNKARLASYEDMSGLVEALDILLNC